MILLDGLDIDYQQNWAAIFDSKLVSTTVLVRPASGLMLVVSFNPAGEPERV